MSRGGRLRQLIDDAQRVGSGRIFVNPRNATEICRLIEGRGGTAVCIIGVDFPRDGAPGKRGAMSELPEGWTMECDVAKREGHRYNVEASIDLDRDLEIEFAVSQDWDDCSHTIYIPLTVVEVLMRRREQEQRRG